MLDAKTNNAVQALLAHCKKTGDGGHITSVVVGGRVRGFVCAVDDPEIADDLLRSIERATRRLRKKKAAAPTS